LVLLVKQGLRPIETLIVGDIVVAANPETNEIADYPIKHCFSREVPVVLDIQIGSTTITCSPEHPFWVVEKGWTAAQG
jgi:hypothetical protein